MMWHPSPKMPEAWARVEWCIRTFGFSLGAYGLLLLRTHGGTCVGIEMAPSCILEMNQIWFCIW
jgi:hypothetical protein